MKSFTSIVGWLLLVTLIAVPSFLFYNWVMQGRSKAEAETTSTGPAINVFPPSQEQPSGAARKEPAAAVKPAPAEPEVGSGPAASKPAARPAAEPPPSASSNPPAEEPPAEAASSREDPAQAQPAAAQPEVSASTAAAGAVDVSTAPKPLSWYTPRTERDPTMTPDDYRRIKDEQRKREEAEKMALYAEQNKPREPGPETRISLQGIVGNAAIINGDMYTAGQVVRGIKILKVGADYINCEAVSGAYKGKKFRKVMR